MKNIKTKSSDVDEAKCIEKKSKKWNKKYKKMEHKKDKYTNKELETQAKAQEENKQKTSKKDKKIVKCLYKMSYYECRMDNIKKSRKAFCKIKAKSQIEGKFDIKDLVNKENGKVQRKIKKEICAIAKKEELTDNKLEPMENLSDYLLEDGNNTIAVKGGNGSGKSKSIEVVLDAYNRKSSKSDLRFYLSFLVLFKLKLFSLFSNEENDALIMYKKLMVKRRRKKIVKINLWSLFGNTNPDIYFSSTSAKNYLPVSGSRKNNVGENSECNFENQSFLSTFSKTEDSDWHEKVKKNIEEENYKENENNEKNKDKSKWTVTTLFFKKIIFQSIFLKLKRNKYSRKIVEDTMHFNNGWDKFFYKIQNKLAALTVVVLLSLSVFFALYFSLSEADDPSKLGVALPLSSFTFFSGIASFYIKSAKDNKIFLNDLLGDPTSIDHIQRWLAYKTKFRKHIIHFTDIDRFYKFLKTRCDGENDKNIEEDIKVIMIIIFETISLNYSRKRGYGSSEYINNIDIIIELDKKIYDIVKNNQREINADYIKRIFTRKITIEPITKENVLEVLYKKEIDYKDNQILADTIFHIWYSINNDNKPSFRYLEEFREELEKSHQSIVRVFKRIYTKTEGTLKEDINKFTKVKKFKDIFYYWNIFNEGFHQMWSLLIIDEYWKVGQEKNMNSITIKSKEKIEELIIDSIENVDFLFWLYFWSDIALTKNTKFYSSQSIKKIPLSWRMKNKEWRISILNKINMNADKLNISNAMKFLNNLSHGIPEFKNNRNKYMFNIDILKAKILLNSFFNKKVFLEDKNGVFGLFMWITYFEESEFIWYTNEIHSLIKKIINQNSQENTMKLFNRISKQHSFSLFRGSKIINLNNKVNILKWIYKEAIAQHKYIFIDFNKHTTKELIEFSWLSFDQKTNKLWLNTFFKKIESYQYEDINEPIRLWSYLNSTINSNVKILFLNKLNGRELVRIVNNMSGRDFMMFRNIRENIVITNEDGTQTIFSVINLLERIQENIDNIISENKYSLLNNLLYYKNENPKLKHDKKKLDKELRDNLDKIIENAPKNETTTLPECENAYNDTKYKELATYLEENKLIKLSERNIKEVKIGGELIESFNSGKSSQTISIVGKIKAERLNNIQILKLPFNFDYNTKTFTFSVHNNILKINDNKITENRKAVINDLIHLWTFLKNGI